MPQRLIPLELSRESITHSYTPIEIERLDLSNFDDIEGSDSVTRHDINWNILNCEIGYRAYFDGGEMCTWASDYIHPGSIPHHLTGSLGLHRFNEVGNVTPLDRHKFIHSVVVDLFKDPELEYVHAWMWANSSQQIKQVLINLGWTPGSWYLYT